MARNPAWLTEDEVADRLGLSLAEVYEEITARRLAAQRWDRSYLVRRADVESYVTQHGVPTA